jgi:hypothetical protein
MIFSRNFGPLNREAEISFALSESVTNGLLSGGVGL